MISLLLIPAALCFTFGRNVKNKKQGIAIFMAMFICLVLALGAVVGRADGGFLAGFPLGAGAGHGGLAPVLRPPGRAAARCGGGWSWRAPSGGGGLRAPAARAG